MKRQNGEREEGSRLRERVPGAAGVRRGWRSEKDSRGVCFSLPLPDCLLVCLLKVRRELGGEVFVTLGWVNGKCEGEWRWRKGRG